MVTPAVKAAIDEAVRTSVSTEAERMAAVLSAKLSEGESTISTLMTQANEQISQKLLQMESIAATVMKSSEDLQAQAVAVGSRVVQLQLHADEMQTKEAKTQEEHARQNAQIE